MSALPLVADLLEQLDRPSDVLRGTTESSSSQVDTAKAPVDQRLGPRELPPLQRRLRGHTGILLGRGRGAGTPRYPRRRRRWPDQPRPASPLRDRRGQYSGAPGLRSAALSIDRAQSSASRNCFSASANRPSSFRRDAAVVGVGERQRRVALIDLAGLFVIGQRVLSNPLLPDTAARCSAARRRGCARRADVADRCMSLPDNRLSAAATFAVMVVQPAARQQQVAIELGRRTARRNPGAMPCRSATWHAFRH